MHHRISRISPLLLGAVMALPLLAAPAAAASSGYHILSTFTLGATAAGIISTAILPQAISSLPAAPM